MPKSSTILTVFLTIITAAAAVVTGYATYRISDHHDIWVAQELDAMDPIKRGFESLGVGKYDVFIKCKDNSVIRISEIVQIDFGGVYVRTEHALLIIRYSEIVSFSVDAVLFL